MKPLPTQLRGRVFDRSEAAVAGLTPAMLRGARICTEYEGVYRYSDTVMTYELQVAAAWRHLKRHAVVSHLTNLRLRGLALGPPFPLHFAANRAAGSIDERIVVHRYRGRVDPELVAGAPMTRPMRTFVDCGTLLPMSELLAVGDWMVAQRLTDAVELRAYCRDVHLDGVRRARVAAGWVRPGSESPTESMVRWHLITHGLPEPALNADITSDRGRFLARGDMVYPEFKVLVEYDGWQHERDRAQRQRDVLRRENLEAEGWLVVVMTSEDLSSGRRIAHRVFNALASRGYAGPRPYLDPSRFGVLAPH